MRVIFAISIAINTILVGLSVIQPYLIFLNFMFAAILMNIN